MLDQELEELTDEYLLGLDIEDDYLSISIDYDSGRPPFLGGWLDNLVEEQDYELRSMLDVGEGTLDYVIELKE